MKDRVSDPLDLSARLDRKLAERQKTTPDQDFIRAAAAQLTGDPARAEEFAKKFGPEPETADQDTRTTRVHKAKRPAPAPETFALISKAEPTPKGRITGALHAECGRTWDLRDGEFRLLLKLAGLLNKEDCMSGRFRVVVCNATLAEEMGVTVRTIQARLGRLEGHGLVYRHYIGGAAGLDRAGIDLAPLVARLGELYEALMDRADDRRKRREELSRPLEGRDHWEIESSPHESSRIHNTLTSQSLSGTAIQEDEARGEAGAHPTTGRAARTGIPDPYRPEEFTPPPRNAASFVRLMEQAAPDLAGGDDHEVCDNARELATGWGVPQKVWARGAHRHGKHAAAAIVAVAASRPITSFKKGRVAWLCACLDLPPSRLNIWASLRATAKRRQH